MKGYKGFTLIELLIVVAIIAILAAIAIPNFLAAQTRSKVSKAKAEQQSIATALESYYVDNNIYPAPDVCPTSGTNFDANDSATNDGQLPRALTTPVSFVSSLFRDPFKLNGKGIYEYGGGSPNVPGSLAVVNGVYSGWPGKRSPERPGRSRRRRSDRANSIAFPSPTGPREKRPTGRSRRAAPQAPPPRAHRAWPHRQSQTHMSVGPSQPADHPPRHRPDGAGPNAVVA